MEEGQRVRITREDLYAQVWAEPATKVAARYGISSTALAKICRKLRVPTPDRGYWALHAVGRAPVKPRLGPPGPNTNLVYDLVHRAPSVPVSSTETSPRLGVEVPETIGDKHPITEQLEDLLRKQARAKNAGVVRPATEHRCIDVSASAGTADRVVRIVDALVHACEARGHRFELTPVSPSRDPYGSRSVTGSFTKLVVGDQPVKFHIEEIIDRVPTVDPKVPATSAFSSRYNRMVELRPSGRLELAIDTYGGGVEQRTWRDGRSRRLEHSLGAFIEAVERVADWCTRRDQETKRREEEQRRQRHRQAVLQEVQRRAETWDSARTIERFLDAVLASDPAAADPSTSKGAVIAFVREQMGLHIADVTTLKGLAMEPT